MGQGITLSPLEPGDYARAATWLAVPEVNRWLYSEWRQATIDERLVAMVARGPRNALYRIDNDGQPYGLCAISSINRADASGMIWFLRAPDAPRVAGGMTRAIAALVDLAFDTHDLHSLTAQVFAENTGSERVLSGAGFTRAGLLRQSALVDGQFLDKSVFDIIRPDRA